MPHAVVFGLIVIGFGLLQLGLSRVLLGVYPKIYSRSFPDHDSVKRKWARDRLWGGVILLTGCGFVVYGLVGGKIIGE